MNINITPVQTKQLQLLDEINDICNKNNIKFYLAERTAIRAYRFNKFPNECFDIKIMMSASDCRKFMDIVENQNSSDRALSYMGKNADYPGFTVKYTALDTLWYNTKAGVDSNDHGLCVEILIIRNRMKSKLKERVLAGYEKGWEYNISKSMAKPFSGEWFSRKLVGLFMIIGRKNLGKMFFNTFMKSYSTNDYDEVWVSRIKKGRKVFPKDYFLKSQPVEFEDKTYYIPQNPELYFESIFDHNWRSEANSGIRESGNQIVSLDTTGKDFLKDLNKEVDLQRYSKQRIKVQNLNLSVRKYKLTVDKAWVIANSAGAKLHLEEYYQPKKDMILRLYKSYDFISLDSVMKYYRVEQRKYAENDVILKFDNELWEILLEVLKYRGQHKYVEKLNHLCKEQNIN